MFFAILKMSIVSIERRIYLEPKYLDSDIMKHLYRKISQITKNECSKEYGHIISIEPNIEIIENENNIFNIKFNAKVFKPEPKNIVEGVVCMISDDGILVKIFDKQLILVPISTMENHTFNEFKEIFEPKSQEYKEIKENTMVKVSIEGVQYNKNNFSCFGCLV